MAGFAEKSEGIVHEQIEMDQGWEIVFIPGLILFYTEVCVLQAFGITIYS